MQGVRWVWSCVLLLLLPLGGNGERFEGQQVKEMDAVFAAKVQETQLLFLGVETQLSAARQVAELFALEDAQLELLALETRARMDAIRGEMKEMMIVALQDVEKTRGEAMANATRWMETLQGLQGATDRNRRVLRQIRDKKQLEKEREEKKKLQELERIEQEEVEKQRELEELEKMKRQRQLETLQKMEKEKEIEKQRQMEEQRMLGQKKQAELDKQRVKAAQSSLGGDAAGQSLGPGARIGTVKRLLAWYMWVEQIVVDVTATVCRQLVLPVVAILVFFLVLTVAIARYNAVKQARRNRRVLYSGYPKSYRPKVRQEVLDDGSDLRPRIRHTVRHRDPNELIGT
ncbi:hypothetical protein PRIC2_003125 [Phytophthora ramorum]